MMIIPPLKIQGKKTKLISFINECAEKILDESPEIDIWIEPFMGTGVVSFNCPKSIKRVVCADINPHIINFYKAIQSGEINADKVTEQLGYHGQELAKYGYDYYRKIKDEFNGNKDPMLFLFLSRTGFNGMMRFNRKGEWNLPFCKINTRLNEKNVEMLAESVKEISDEIHSREYIFHNEDFKAFISSETEEYKGNSMLYCDPPYLGLYTDYFCGWDESNEKELSDLLKDKIFILSTWSNNGVKDNEAIGKYWGDYKKFDLEHFYNVAAKAENRRKITESLICNY